MTEYEKLRADYIEARDVAATARQAWDQFLPTTPGGGAPATTGNIDNALRTLVAAERAEKIARDALFNHIKTATP